MVNNFSYLDMLLSSGKKSISLNDDFLNHEKSDPINIDTDGIVIDGNHHRIDAGSKTQIFKITARNVTIKNIRFKHGFADEGGVISNEGEVRFEHCTFSFNDAESLGGAIFNKGTIEMSKCRLNTNRSKSGGAIHNLGDIRLEKCLFTDNVADVGGVIFNEGNLEIDGGGIRRNLAKSCGGAIVNKGETIIKNASFSANVSYGAAHAICNFNRIEILGCEFKFANDYLIDCENATSKLKDNNLIEN